MLQRFFVFLVILSFVHPLLADNTDNNGIINEDNKKSSSFVVDPDPLDPLPVKRENIKDGDEIILDDIRQVLDQPTAKPNAKAEPGATGDSAVQLKTKSTKKNVKSSRKSKKSNSSLAEQNENRSNDEADSRIEDRLHSTYQKFNISPTSIEQWAAATGNQKENIYVVQKHDTLFTISQTLFGDSKFWPKIWALNRSSILNPHYIYPGMKIYFYSGDAVSVPTVSLKTTNSDGTADQAQEEASVKDGDKYFIQGTEFQKTTTLDGKTKFTDPTAIPDSLPLTRNAKYNMKEDEKVQIDLKTFEYSEQQSYKNPYILTSSELKSDFKVPFEQIENFLCVENQFVPLVERRNVDAPSGKYHIIEKLSSESKRLKDTNKYKIIGSVTINEKNQMRVNNCQELMDSQSIIISDEKLKAANDPTEEFSYTARIVDGLDYRAQELYAEQQYLVINLEGLNVDTGADLSIFSESLGKRVGRLRIVKRTGTVAVAVITKVYDIINRGDTITE